MCAFYLAGKCTYGAECKFSHSTASGDTSRIPQCKFWLQGTCRHGSRCMFSHNTNAPIARKSTVSTEEQIENLTQDMLNGTTAARVLPNGVLQYYTANDNTSTPSKISSYPATPARMYCYPAPQTTYFAPRQAITAAPLAGMNYFSLPNGGIVLQPNATSLPGHALVNSMTYTTPTIAQAVSVPAPTNNTLLKRKLVETNSESEATPVGQVRKKTRRDEAVSETLTATQPKQEAVSTGGTLVASQGAPSTPMLLIPLKPGRPLINAPQSVGGQTASPYAQQAIAPASYVTLSGQTQLLTNQIAFQQRALQNPAIIQYPTPVFTLQSPMTARPQERQ